MEFNIHQIRNYIQKQDSLGDVLYNLSEQSIYDANMVELYSCSSCGNESENDDDFKTDLDQEVDRDEMVCENCYDQMNENM